MIEGGQRVDGFQYPDREWFYFQMADRFGWTPDQVGEVPAVLADWLLMIGATVDQVKAAAANG